MCAGCDEIIYASEIRYDGIKLGCGDKQIKPCDKLSKVIETLFGIACKPVVLYTVEKLGNGTVTGVLTSTTYTVPVDGDGDYEIEYWVDCVLPTGAPPATISLDARKNTVVINNDAQRIVQNNSASNLTMNQVFFLSKITCVAGDVLDMYATIVGPAGTYPARGVCKITKIG